ncbi:MAG: hypothetical protein WC365_07760 [Candidatus Babeliales bacterium]
MRTIVIGCLGSMGRRRIRNLKALGYTDIIGYDLVDYKKAKPDCWYTDMLDEVENFLENPTGLYKKVDCIIVSVPPLQKQKYIDLGNKYNVTVFCEADVTEYSGSYAASATMRFHPAIQKIKELLDSGTLGKVYTFMHHCGNHIEDWHPGCDKKTYYAMAKEAGGCKEIFPFELSWLSYLFGTPVYASGVIDKKLNDPDISADDIYSTVVMFQNEKMQDYGFRCWPQLSHITGTVLIDIVSRPAIRELRIVCERGFIEWNWNDDHISIRGAEEQDGMLFFDKGKAAGGYHSSICEEMYISEIANFINAIQGKEQYLYSREDEKVCIEMLRKVEGK